MSKKAEGKWREEKTLMNAGKGICDAPSPFRSFSVYAKYYVAKFLHVPYFLFFQESGSVYLQFLCSTDLQLEVIFEVLEEFDWTAFSVVTTRHHGYEDFLAMVEGMIDGSFIGWERKSVVMLNLTDDPGGARTRRLLKENEAQVRSENINAVDSEHLKPLVEMFLF